MGYSLPSLMFTLIVHYWFSMALIISGFAFRLILKYLNFAVNPSIPDTIGKAGGSYLHESRCPHLRIREG